MKANGNEVFDQKKKVRGRLIDFVWLHGGENVTHPDACQTILTQLTKSSRESRVFVMTRVAKTDRIS